MATNTRVPAAGTGNEVVGKVVILYGTVKAISPDGTIRLLMPNSPIFANDRIVTESDGNVSIMFDGTPPTQMDLGRMSNVVVDEDVYAGGASSVASDAAAEAEQIQKALMAGDQPIDIEATAAGGDTGVGGGHPVFVVDVTGAEVTPTSGAGTIGVSYGTTGTLDGVLATNTITLTDGVTMDEGGAIIYTATLTHAAQGDIVVTLSNGSQITIPNGATNGAVTVPAPSDDVYIDAGSVTTTITGATGGSETLVVNTTPVVTAIPDTLDITTVSLSGPSTVTEGAAATYIITVDHVPQTPMTVDVTYTYLSASSNDVVTSTTQIIIPAGQSTAQFSVGTVDDQIDEANEIFSVSVSNPQGGNFENLTIGTSTVQTAIVDNDVPTIFVGSAGTGLGDITVPEGTDAVFGIKVAGAAEGSTLTLTLADGTAVSPEDYASGTFQYSIGGGAYSDYTGPVTLSAGASDLLIKTTTVDDLVDESNETFTLGATLNSLGTSYSDSGTATIVDNDVPTIFVGSAGTGLGDITVPEGTDAVFGIKVAGAAEGSTLTLTLADGTAVSPEDYASGTFQYSIGGGAYSDYTGPVTLSAGASDLLIKTTTVDDLVDESNETFTLGATLNSLGTSYSDSGTATIVDNDVPTIFVGSAGTGLGDITVPEGTDAVFGIKVAGAAEGSTLTLTLADGTAVSPEDYASGTFQYSIGGGAYSDYTGPVTLSAGASDLLIKTTTVDDLVDESNETFTLGATLNSLGTSYSDSGTATIVDNDVPTIFVGSAGTGLGDITVPEGTDAVFGIKVAGAAEGSTLTLTLADGTAVSPEDYASGTFQYSIGGDAYSDYTGPVTLSAGASDLLIKTTTVDDLVDESNETFTLGATLNSLGTSYSDSGTATIVDNDVLPSFSINDVTVNEADGTITFTVTKDGLTDQPSSVDYAVAPNTAVTPDDYAAGTNALTGTLAFAAGVTTQTITLNVANDAVYELTENFNVNLSNSVAATISDAHGVGTIVDNDALPSFSINDVTVNEADGTITFTVTKDGLTDQPSSVDYSVAPNTAVTPDDYASGTNALTGTLAFAAGVTTQTITLNVANDAVYELTENFNVNLSNSVAATISDAQGVGTIVDNDALPSFSINDVTVNEADGTITFTVTKDGLTDQPSSVDYSVAPNTAVTPDDYASGTNALTGTLAFAAGVTTQTITLNVANDAVYELTETFNVNLSNSVAATISDNQGIGTIVDNDSIPISIPDSDVTVYESALDLVKDPADLVAGTVTGTDPTGTGETDSDNTLVGSVSGGAGGYTYSLVGSSTGTYGVIELNSDGTYTYTLTSPVTSSPPLPGDVPANTEVAADTFTYMVTDSAGQPSAPSTITVNIVDDVPTISADNIAIPNIADTYEGTYNFDVGADTQAFNASIVDGSLTWANAPSGYSLEYDSYDPVLNAQVYNGTYNNGANTFFTITVNDDGTYLFNLVEPKPVVESEPINILQGVDGGSNLPNYIFDSATFDGYFDLVATGYENGSLSTLTISATDLGVGDNVIQEKSGDVLRFELNPTQSGIDSNATVSEFNVSLADTASIQDGTFVELNVHYTDSSVVTLEDQYFKAEGGDLVFELDPLKTVDYFELYNDPGDGKDFSFKIDGVGLKYSTTSYPDDYNLQFSLSGADADGDSTSANFTVAVNTSTVTGNEIIGTSGVDTLYGTAGDDTLTGGAGADTFKVGEGNDLIKDFTVGVDKLIIDTAHNDVLFEHTAGTTTVQLTVNNNGSQVGSVVLEGLNDADSSDLLSTLLNDDPTVHS